MTKTSTLDIHSPLYEAKSVGPDDGRVVVADVMDAVAGEKIGNHAAISSVHFHAFATRVPGIHVQRFEESDRPGIDVIGVILKEC